MSGKVVLITGAGSGIGAACAKALARQGATVVVADLDGAAGGALVESLTAQGHAAVFQPLDVTDELTWIAMVGDLEARFGRLDGLVANAGIMLMGMVTEMPLADWRRQNSVNIDGVFLAVKHCLPLMRQTRGGSIVVMSSVAGLRGSAGFSGYCASKAAIRNFAKAVAMECAAEGDGIRVNSVHPGVVDTPLWQTVPIGGKDGRPARFIDPARMGQSDAPLGRSGSPDEVAAAASFLLSDASRYITGTELVIDGGILGGAMPKRKA